MKKKYILILISLVTSTYIFAQDIELPDITTEIEGEAFKVENDALPDFNDVLKLPHGSGNIVPELPEIPVENVADNNIKEIDQKDKKNIFSEILIAGGYPLLFKGHCSLFSSNQQDPFKLLFKFDSANGYKGHSVTENYSDKNIDLVFEKQINKDKINIDINTEYNYISNGLQMKSPVVNIMNQEFVTGTGVFEYNFGNGFSAGAYLNLDLYNRYGSIVNTGDFPFWIKRNFIFNLNPEISGHWSGHGFNLGLSIGYLGAFNSSKNIAGGMNNRGNVKFDFQWANDFVKVFSDFSVVFGNQFNNHNEAGALVPFKLGVNFKFPVYFANRKFGISAEGGLDSYYNSVKELEYKYKFAAFNEMPMETSYWYGNINFDVPLKTSFSANVSATYKQTAFNKGFWEPDYFDTFEDNFSNGIYIIKKKNQQILATDLDITYHYKFFFIKGGLHSNWLDVPALEGLQTIKLNIGFKDDDSKWGVNLFGEYNITENSSLPVINLDCFVQISPTIRITASMGDIVSLFSKNERIYGGIYADRGFTGAVLLSLVL